MAVSNVNANEELDKKFQDMSFREGMDLLEATVRELESGTLELEDSLKKYSEGVALLTNLQKRLSEAEQQVEVLMGELAAPLDDDQQDTTLS